MVLLALLPGLRAQPGSLDPVFGADLSFNDTIFCLTPAPDNKWIVGGDFAAAPSLPRARVARIHSTGLHDGSFNPTPGANGSVYCVLAQPDKKVIVGGTFSTLNSVSRPFLGRFNTFGDLDTAFTPTPNGLVQALALQADGKILVAGAFTSISGTARQRVARLNVGGSLDESFDTTNGPDGPVFALGVQPNGRVIIGGNFLNVEGSPQPFLARLNTNGTVDQSFAVDGGPDYLVQAVQCLPDGRILIGGIFSHVAGFERPGVARLLEDGAVDPTFQPGPIDGGIKAVAAAADDKVIIAGEFTEVEGVPRQHVARLSADGSLDFGFDPGSGANSYVNALALQADDSLLLGGYFTTYDGTPRPRIARVLGGAADPETPWITGQPTNQVVPAGTTAKFTVGVMSFERPGFQWQFEGANLPGAVNPVLELTGIRTDQAGQYRVVITNSLGSVTSEVATLTVTVSPPVFLLQPSNTFACATQYGVTLRATVSAAPPAQLRWYFNGTPIAGETNVVWQATNLSTALTGEYFVTASNQVGLVTSQVAAVTIYPDPLRTGPGTLDPTFSAGVTWGVNGGSVRAMAAMADGRIVISGDFSAVNGIARNRLARLFPDGTVDPSFVPGPRETSYATSLSVREDGSVYLAGPQMYSIDGTNVPRVARLKPNGSLDLSFAPPPELAGAAWNGYVAFAALPNGQLLFGGHRQIVRFNADGSLDGAFPPAEVVSAGGGSGNPGGIVSYGIILPQPDQKVVLLRSDPMGPILRRLPSGANDLTFSSSIVFQGSSHPFEGTAILQPDGKIILSARVSPWYASTPVWNLVRLNPDGSLDSSFNVGTGPNISPTALALQSDGSIYIGGRFTHFNGVARPGLARLNKDGSLDTTFDPGAGVGKGAVWYPYQGAVHTLLVQPNGQLLIGGDFSACDCQVAAGLARIRGDTPASPSLSSQPTNQSVVEGQSARFLVEVSPSPSPSFQWQFNELDLVGETNAVLQFASARATNTGDYRVIITNSFGAVTSSVASLTVAPAASNAGAPDLRFDPGEGANGSIRVVVRQPDGRILIAGQFTAIDGIARGGLARLHPDGRVDESFNPGPEAYFGGVAAIALLNDGRILVGGYGGFVGAGGVIRQSVARLYPDGGLDTSFDAGTGAMGIDATVNALLPQVDGKVMVAGAFSTFNGQLRYSVARLNADGSLDSSFVTPAIAGGARYYALAGQPDGQILIGGLGGMGRLKSNGTWENTFGHWLGTWEVRVLAFDGSGRLVIGGRSLGTQLPYQGVQRFNADLTWDSSFTPLPMVHATDVIRSIIYDECGKPIVAGLFRPTNQTYRVSVARLEVNGRLDPLFATERADSGAYGVVPLDNGGVCIAGEFASIRGVGRHGIARLHLASARPGILAGPIGQSTSAGRAVELATVLSNDCLVPTMQWFRNGIPIEGATNAVLALPNPSPADAGLYTLVASNSAGSVMTTPVGLAVSRGNIDPGQADTGFHPGLGADAAVRALAVQPDGKVLIGGDFTNVHGVARHGIARLHRDGRLDLSFTPGAGVSLPLFTGTATVRALALADDGKIVIAGRFDKFDGTNRLSFARLHSSGTLDLAFNPLFSLNNYPVNLAMVEPDRRVIIGVDGGLMRFNTNGTRDQVFNPYCNGTFLSASRDFDGRLFVGGDFTTAGSFQRQRVARFHSNGTLDLAFNTSAGANSSVLALAVESTGKVIVGGSFTNVAGVTRYRIARIHEDGTLDPTFDPGLGANASVNAVAVQSDGKIYIAGSFTTWDGLPSGRLVRLLSNGTVDPTFNAGPGADGSILALALDHHGLVHLGGSFTNFNTFPRRGVARIHGHLRASEPLRANQEFSVQVQTTSGWDYHLERSISVEGQPWESIATLPGTGSIQTLRDDTAANGGFFYRVRVE